MEEQNSKSEDAAIVKLPPKILARVDKLFNARKEIDAQINLILATTVDCMDIDLTKYAYSSKESAFVRK